MNSLRDFFQISTVRYIILMKFPIIIILYILCLSHFAFCCISWLPYRTLSVQGMPTTVETQLRRMNDHFPAQIGDWSQRICTSEFGVAQQQQQQQLWHTARQRTRAKLQCQLQSRR